MMERAEGPVEEFRKIDANFARAFLSPPSIPVKASVRSTATDLFLGAGFFVITEFSRT